MTVPLTIVTIEVADGWIAVGCAAVDGLVAPEQLPFAQSGIKSLRVAVAVEVTAPGSLTSAIHG